MPFDPNAADVVEVLVAGYLSRSGVPSSPFVQRFKKCSLNTQDAVNNALVAKGLPPYTIRKAKRPSGQITVRQARQAQSTQPAQPTVAKVLSAEDLKRLDVLLAALDTVMTDKSNLREFLAATNNIETDIRRQLTELTGTNYIKVLNDPYLEIYQDAHKHARNNKEEIAASTTCGCFFCQAVFDAKIPMEWVDNGKTALCPNCGIDSVIGGKAGYELSPEFLQAMFVRWFSTPLRLQAARPVSTAKPLESTPAPATEPITPVVDKWQWNKPVEEKPVEPEEMVIPTHLLADDNPGIGSALISSIEDEDEEDEF